MVKKYRRNRSSDSFGTSQPMVGRASFTGKKKTPGCSLELTKLPKKFLHVGELIELECETPLETAVDSYKLVKSVGRPIVMADEHGKYVVVVAANKKKGIAHISPDDPIVRDAAKLYAAFHGTEVDKVEKIDTEETKVLVFWGYLNHIVYAVPERSERRGVPFIHEAKDRGDDVPPADEKPIVCVSPNRDFLIMYGPQFTFTERGMIG